MCLLLALSLLLSPAPPAPPPDPSPAPAVSAPAAPSDIRLILIRHAEAGGEPADNPGLSDAGRRRLACVLAALRDEPITHVVTSPFRRARETAGPLAADHALEPVAKDPLDAARLAAELEALPAGSVAVVVGHSNTLPALVTALGGRLDGLIDERGQPAFPRDQFDRLIRLRLRAGAAGATGGEAAAGAGVGSRLIALEDARQPCPGPAPSPR